MKRLDQTLFKSLQKTASDSGRGRAHHTLHPEPSDPVQRMCVAINPGSYIQPHRHASPPKWELFLILKGSASILVFDNHATVINRIDLNPVGPVHACEIPQEEWHTLVCHDHGTLLVEIKPGPYEPLVDKDFANWAPKEGEDKSIEMENLFRGASIGDRFKY